jgi:hypothetical protein
MEKAGNLLNSLLGSALSREAEKYSSFFHFFKDVLGEQLARQIRIRDIENHVVIAEANHPGWIQTFAMKKAAVLSKLNLHFPDLKIRDIHIKLAAKGTTAKITGKSAASGEGALEKSDPLIDRMELLSPVQQDKVVKQLFSHLKHRTRE